MSEKKLSCYPSARYSLNCRAEVVGLSAKFEFMLSAGKAERAERSGLPVMLSVSETSHLSKRSPYGDPSLTLPVYASLRDRQDDAPYFLCNYDKESNNNIIKLFFVYQKYNG